MGPQMIMAHAKRRPLCHQNSLFVTSSVPICIRSTQKSWTSMPLFAKDLASVVLESGTISIDELLIVSGNRKDGVTIGFTGENHSWT